MKRIAKSRLSAVVYVSFIAFLSFAGCPIGEQGPLKQDVEILTEFSTRVTKYSEQHKAIEASLPKLPDRATPEQIVAHRKALAAAIIAARADAQPGDILFPAVKRYLTRIIRSEFQGPGGKQARAAIETGNPEVVGSSTKVQLMVNSVYPVDAPLSLVPPSLLLKLPPLPDELQYRFVGRDLILRGVTANLIIDFIVEAVPER